MQRASGTFDLRRSGGLAKQSPLLALLFLIPAMSLAGIPPLSGFWAKFTIIGASYRAEAGWLAALGLFVGLMTLYSMSKIWIHAFWKPARIERIAPRRIPVPMVLAILGLGLVTVVIGLQPDPLYRFATEAAAELADRGGYIRAVLGAAPVIQELP
jgi:multicomponent Na+:H+ antiporter subunit D